MEINICAIIIYKIFLGVIIMRVNGHYRLGLRAIKTAVAVSICLFICVAFNRDAYFLSAFAAIVCMQQTYDQTFSEGVHRLFGTIVGGSIGYMLLQCSVLLPWYNKWCDVIFAPLCLLLVIYICNTFYKQPSVSIACIVMLCIISQPDGDINDVRMYAINRVIDTSIGIIIAMCINRFFYPKRKNKMDCNKIDDNDNQTEEDNEIEDAEEKAGDGDDADKKLESE